MSKIAVRYTYSLCCPDGQGGGHRVEFSSLGELTDHIKEMTEIDFSDDEPDVHTELFYIWRHENK